jgi:hypothetical protein
MCVKKNEKHQISKLCLLKPLNGNFNMINKHLQHNTFKQRQTLSRNNELNKLNTPFFAMCPNSQGYRRWELKPHCLENLPWLIEPGWSSPTPKAHSSIFLACPSKPSLALNPPKTIFFHLPTFLRITFSSSQDQAISPPPWPRNIFSQGLIIFWGPHFPWPLFLLTTIQEHIFSLAHLFP